VGWVKLHNQWLPQKSVTTLFFLRKRQCECHGRFHHDEFPRYIGRGKTVLTTYPLLCLSLRNSCHRYGCFHQNICAHFKIIRDYTESGSKIWRYLSYNKMKSVLSFYVNLLLKLSLSQSILITVFSSWILCLWGGVLCCQHIPAGGGLLTEAWRPRSKFSGVLGEGSLAGRFLFAADAVSLQFLNIHSITVLRLGTLSFRWVLKCRRNICWFTTTEHCFRNTSPQRKPDDLQTSAPWQLKSFESR